MSFIFTQIKNITYSELKLFGKLNSNKNLVIVNFRMGRVLKGNLVFLWVGVWNFGWRGSGRSLTLLLFLYTSEFNSRLS